jgi:kynurenine formamidase
MLSRRHLLKRGVAGAAAVVAAGTIGSPAVAASHSSIQAAKVADMTHTVSPEFPTYFGVPGIKSEQKFKFEKDGFNVFELTVNEHTGTHIDAPLHFSKDGQSVDEIPIENLVVPLAVIDIKDKAAASADAQVTPEDIKK